MDFSTSTLLLCLFAFPFTTAGQQVPTDTLPGEIRWWQADSMVQFQSELRPLRQIAGAPEAFYTYLWEFGDGDFSFNETPQHVFRDSGAYTVRLFATNNYDDGAPPPVHPRRIQVTSGNALAANYNHDGFFKEGRQIQLKVNRMPKPGEDIICIIGYQNPEAQETLSGSLVLFFNDKAFKNRNFGLADLREYHGEQGTNMATLLARCRAGKEVPLIAVNDRMAHGPNRMISTTIVSNTNAVSLLQQKQELFDSHSTLHFSNMAPGEKRYVFAVLHTTPEMIKDTNATVTLNAMLIPDDPEKPIQENNLALQIVTSHDPNRLMLGNRRLNYRLMGQHKRLKYKIRFQNTGKGPARLVAVGVKVPPALDPTTLELNDMYPECIPCATARSGQSCLDTLITQDSIHFVFRNIYLPGIRQDNLEDKDSTRGFVEYHLRFEEKPPKLPFWSQAAIVFDKNDPVYTNRMHTRYLHGISPAVIAGYLKGFDDEHSSQSPFIIGAALAPYSPYRFYFQAEAYLGIYKKSTLSRFHDLEHTRDTVYERKGYLITAEGTIRERNLLSLDIVPLEVRQNLNDWLGIGAGLWLKGNLYEKTRITPQVRITDRESGTVLDLPGTVRTQKETFSNVNPGAFMDVNIGRVRVGPALGMRLLHFFSPDQTGLMLYAIWRL